jgi:hypothetical protein
LFSCRLGVAGDRAALTINTLCTAHFWHRLQPLRVK